MKNLADSLYVGTPQHVLAHAEWRRHRKGAGPTAPFNGIRDPRRALQAAIAETQKMGRSFGYRLSRHLMSEQNGKKGSAFCRITEMRTYAIGVVGVKNSQGRLYVYFCREDWKLTDPPATITARRAFPPNLRGTDIGILAGQFSDLEPDNFTTLCLFAKQCLKKPRRKELCWHNEGQSREISLR